MGAPSLKLYNIATGSRCAHPVSLKSLYSPPINIIIKELGAKSWTPFLGILPPLWGGLDRKWGAWTGLGQRLAVSWPGLDSVWTGLGRPFGGLGQRFD